MSRSFDREEVEGRGTATASDGTSGPSALSRSGGDDAMRPRSNPEDETSGGFGENRRERFVHRDEVYRVRPSEEALLRDLGTFRVVQEIDLVKGAFRGDAQLARADFRSLRQQGLIRSINFHGIRGGSKRVHTLTAQGHDFVSARSGEGPQFYYWGVVKPAEVEHDSLLYRAYLREGNRIRSEGGAIKRVILDTELKREHYKRVNKPGSFLSEGASGVGPRVAPSGSRWSRDVS